MSSKMKFKREKK